MVTFTFKYTASYLLGFTLHRFLFGVLTYLVAGSAFQYFVKQERGIRVLPNFDFWKNFLLLTMVRGPNSDMYTHIHTHRHTRAH